MIKAKFVTPNFTFEAYANSDAEALILIKKAWKKHSKQTGADPKYLDEYKDDIYYCNINIGKAYKDGEEV